MATIYLDIPIATPTSIQVYQASTVDGTRTLVVDDVYGAFAQSGGKIIITDAGLSTAKYSFVTYTYSGVATTPLIIYPLGDLSGTAQALLDRILPRLVGEPPPQKFFDTLAQIIRYIDRRLFANSSDILMVDHTASLSIDEYQANLPAGFMGLDSDPYITYSTSTKKCLTPLLEEDRGTYTETGIPEKYELRGMVINVYPTCSEAVTLVYRSYDKSTPPTTFSGRIPYNGLFDDLICDIFIRFGYDALGAYADKVIETAVYSAVDEVLSLRQPKTVKWRYPV